MDIVFLLVPLALLSWLALDYRGPRIVRIRPGKVFGFSVMDAHDLIVHEFDGEENLWATRGYLIYHRKPGDNRFIKTGRIPHGKWIYWLNNFSLVRRLTGKPECMEMTLTRDHGICALSGGMLWFGEPSGETMEAALRLPHYGPGIGRGVLNNGLLFTSKGKLFFGEYFNNPERIPVCMYKSDDLGKTWFAAYTFPSGEIRHIHVIQEDPFTENIWYCTGDLDPECRIGWTGDDFKSLHTIGSGSQQWRTCHLVFTPEAVYWGTDTGSEAYSGIYRWDRLRHKTTKICSVDGAVFFGTRLSNGMIVMTTDREGFPNEKNDKTMLIRFMEHGPVKITPCGSWNRKKGFGASFAQLRMPRGAESHYLALTVLNQTGISEGRLVMIDEEELAAGYEKETAPLAGNTY